MSFLVRLLNFQRWVNTLLSLTLGRLKCVDSVRHEGPKVSTSSKGSCLSRTPPIWVDEIQEYMTHVYSLWNGSRYNMLCTLFILKKKNMLCTLHSLLYPLTCILQRFCCATFLWNTLICLIAHVILLCLTSSSLGWLARAICSRCISSYNHSVVHHQNGEVDVLYHL